MNTVGEIVIGAVDNDRIRKEEEEYEADGLMLDYNRLFLMERPEDVVRYKDDLNFMIIMKMVLGLAAREEVKD